MASRAALRVLANVVLCEPPQRKWLVLYSMYSIVTSASRGLGQSAEADLLAAANSASERVTSALGFLPPSSAHSSVRSASCSASSAASTNRFASPADSAAKSIAYSADAAANRTIYSATSKDSQHPPAVLITKPVWGDIPIPESIAENHADFLAYLDRDPDWDFFRRWYLAMWEGGFEDWDLMLEVAKIPDEIWGEGLAAVAEAIRGIEARRDLLDQIAALKEEVSKLRLAQTAPAVGHNQGPPLDDQEVKLRGQIELIWPVLDELEHEVEQSEPDPERIKVLAQKLWAIAVVVAKYCGGKLDIALDKAVETASEEGTKWAVRVGVGTYVTTNEGVQAIAKAAWKLAMGIAAG